MYASLATAPVLKRGHKVVTYHGRSNIEAGVQVAGTFEGGGAVQPSATPGGRRRRFTEDGMRGMGQLEREPTVADLDVSGVRFFILEKQSEGKDRDHRFKRPSGVPRFLGSRPLR